MLVRRAMPLSGRYAIVKQELARFDAIKMALQKAASVDEAKGIRDRAEALRIYAKQSGQSLDVLNRCAEIKLSAERRAGEILLDMEKNKGARGKGVRYRDEGAPTLAELGISQVQSHRWQKIASIPLRDFEGFIRERKREGKELTSVSVLRLASELRRRPIDKPQDGEIDPWLPHIRTAAEEPFSTIVVDPPWDQLGRRTGDLWNLPVQTMCARNAHLYLWVTNGALEQGFELLRYYGFRYVNCLTWCKSGPEREGTYYPSSTEHILVGVKGTLELKRRDVGTWFQWPWGHIHSEKPDRFYELVMSCSPGPYAVLFSKKQRPGWTCAGLDLRTVATVRNQRVWEPLSAKGAARQPQVIEVRPNP
jgi:N6-adenosine-specific RNA methylase IME4